MTAVRNARTAAKISEEIDEISEEKEAVAATFRKKQKALNAEYNEAVAKESATRKLDQMSKVEKDEFRKLLKEGN